MMTSDYKTPRSTDGKNKEELSELKNVNLLAIANKKSGPPTRIPLPTGRQFVQLTASSKEENSTNSRNGGSRVTQSKHVVQQYPVRKASAEVLTADITSPKFPGEVPQYTGPIPPSEYMHGSGPGDNSDSSKRRKRYMYMRRKNVSASPKANSAGKGQSKQASDSDAERARNKRRRRKSLRKINQSPSSDEAGPDTSTLLANIQTVSSPLDSYRTVGEWNLTPRQIPPVL